MLPSVRLEPPECLTRPVLSFLSKVYNPRIRADSLVTQPISRSQADTRKQLLGSSSSGSPTVAETAVNP